MKKILLLFILLLIPIKCFCYSTSASSAISMDTDNNKVEIDWEDRNDPDIIKSIAGFKKHVVKIGDERKEFISDYDFVKYLANNADSLKETKVTVTGQTSVNVYNGKISQRFVIQNIYEVDDETKNQLRITTPYYFNKNSFDFTDSFGEKRSDLFSVSISSSSEFIFTSGVS